MSYNLTIEQLNLDKESLRYHKVKPHTSLNKAGLKYLGKLPKLFRKWISDNLLTTTYEDRSHLEIVVKSVTIDLDTLVNMTYSAIDQVYASGATPIAIILGRSQLIELSNQMRINETIQPTHFTIPTNYKAPLAGNVGRSNLPKPILWYAGLQVILNENIDGFIVLTRDEVVELTRGLNY